MIDWMHDTFGPDWQAYVVYAIGATIFVVGMGYGIWKGNGR